MPSERLDSLRNGWRVETVVHGDIRPEPTCSSCEEVASRTGTSLGWSTGRWRSSGDPAWDPGGALQPPSRRCGSTRCRWQASLSIDEASGTASEFPGSVSFHGLSCSLWHAYECSLDHSESTADALLDRAVELSAVSE